MKKYSELTVKDMSNSGQALVLLFLIAALVLGERVWLWLATAGLVVNMASPKVFRPFAFVWLNFSHYLGLVVSHILMTAMFLFLVLPVGLVRRAMGKDAMALKKWRNGRESVFIDRKHVFVSDDLRKPY